MNTLWLYLLLLDPHGLATMGGSKSIHFEQDSLLMDWSIGQPLSTEEFENGNTFTISTGFLQNKNCNSCLFNSMDSFLVDFKIGPNPVNENVQIHLNQAGLVWQAVEIYSLEGKLIQKLLINRSCIQLHHTLRIGHYDKGFYILKLYFLIEDVYPISKIIQLYKS